MSDAGKLLRGEKWIAIRKQLLALGSPDNLKKVKWMDSQLDIQKDIKFYENSIKPKPEVKSKRLR